MSESLNRTSVRIPSAIALGMFDGMHIGHRSVIARTVQIAKEKSWNSVVYTFENHPRSVFSTAPVQLMSAEHRREIMKKMGVDTVDMVWFDKAMAAMEPEEFMDALSKRYTIGAIVAGSDYTFGYLGKGTIDTLREMAPRYGYFLEVVPFVKLEGEKVSSTRIREVMEEGNTELVRRMMGDSEDSLPVL